MTHLLIDLYRLLLCVCVCVCVCVCACVRVCMRVVSVHTNALCMNEENCS